MAIKVVSAVIVLFVIFYVVTKPDHAATIANGAWSDVTGIAHSISTFVDKLGS